MLSAITIDVDALRFYGAIHGLGEGVAGGDLAGEDPIYSVALPRFFELLEEVGVPSTVFFIAEDAHLAEGVLKAGLSATGSELASHSLRHDYRLGTRGQEEIRKDLTEAHRILSDLAGQPVCGFRAPGYNTTPEMLRVLVDLGYRYDSSLLPAPVYFLARAVAIAAYALGRRPSSSMIGQWRAFAGPRSPYRTRPESPWRPDSKGPLLEIPMAVEPLTRLPIIGTSWVVFPGWLRRWLLRSALRTHRPFVFEMHAIDVLDGSDPGVPPSLAAAQPDLRRPAREKIPALRELFRRLADETEVLPLRDLAGRLPEGSATSPLT